MLVRLEGTRFAVEMAATFLTGVFAVIAAFYVSLPDRSRFWLALPLPPLLLRVDGQAPLQGAIGRRGHPGLVENPQAVELADRLDDPRQHQLPEDLVSAGCVLQP